MQPTLRPAVAAARAAGKVINYHYDKLYQLEISQKSRNDFVSNVDKKAQDEIIAVLSKAYPEHGFIAEEEHTYQEKEYTWIIDPLDGTLNFINGFPHFCVSIALKVKGKIEHGVIYDPLRNELFTASRGFGALLDERKIRVKQEHKLESALLGTGFPTRYPELLDKYCASFNAILKQAIDVRRAGAAALDLAYVACGRLDGYWEMGLKIWDLAAGALLVKEAGGFVGDFAGTENYLLPGNINLIAGNIKLYKAILQHVR